MVTEDATNSKGRMLLLILVKGGLSAGGKWRAEYKTKE
jgi:hypothetical protein